MSFKVAIAVVFRLLVLNIKITEKLLEVEVNEQRKYFWIVSVGPIVTNS